MLLNDTTVYFEHLLLEKFRIKSSQKIHCCKGSRRERVAPAVFVYIKNT